ncbi:tRNA modification GTPase [Bacteriovorax sp. Seq25_V]|uniref:tRNA modification GTPase n=1 Tax=Bacteriovorax sp. Seq25_V TaxID=1201288 RepID=UPI00038A3080|nr:GTPase [Bacteriovorax sp. Seq25_V]EQC43408.1 putative tRNA modification GTPase TrmE [Bacteriovorax sp. Seq25_V]
MIFNFDDKPIVACSSGVSENTAIGLIRLSGFPELTYLKDFFNFDISKLQPNTAKFCKLYYENTVLDEVVVTYFKGPNSYNGENILEISAHGNVLNIKRIISCFVSSGLFRMAKNGEFTYRALLNKKLTLAQVEGLDTLLNASSGLMLEQGFQLLNGDLYRRYQNLYQSFLKLKSAIEINIDFAEDVGEEQSIALLQDSTKKLGKEIAHLKKSANVSKKAFMSPDIILVGEPNSGKSSLFNLLLDDNRAIVSDIAGTTRDFITEYIEIENNTYKLIDTAGLRITSDTIEEEGIRRAVSILDNAFYKILLLDITKISEFNFSFSEETIFDAIIFNHCDKLEKPINTDSLRVLPQSRNVFFLSVKEDFLYDFGPMGALLESGSIEPLIKKIISGSIGPASENGSTGSIGPKISDEIRAKFSLLKSQDPIVVDRHRQVINEISDSYDVFTSNINNLGDIAIISAESRILGNKISELIGIISPDDILSNIFSNFCIGK